MPDKLPPRDVRCESAKAADREEARMRHADLLRSIGPLPPMLSPSRVAAILDTHRQRVYEMIASGTLEHVKLGQRALRVPRGAFERFLARACGLDQCDPADAPPVSRSRGK